MNRRPVIRPTLGVGLNFIYVLFLVFLLTLLAVLLHARLYAQTTLPEQQVQFSSLNAYGTSDTVGEALERCDTESSVSKAIVLSPTDAWEERIEDDVVPGDTFLLRGGIYQASDKLWIPDGLPGQPITIKPYNCESVTLHTSIRPGSHTVLAGVRLEAKGISDTKWAIRVDGKNKGPIRDLVIRHNTILGGKIDALRVSDDVVGLTLYGNHVDGGEKGHAIFITSEKRKKLPDRIDVTNNRLTKTYFDHASEDMFQVRDALHIEFTHNVCEEGHRMEQCIDIKRTEAPVIIRHNLFNGNTLHQSGPGEDGADGCMVIHEDGPPDKHLIEQNYFLNCQGTAIRFAPGTQGRTSSGTVQHNLFVNSDSVNGVIPIWQAQDVHFINNTVIRGRIKLGDADQKKLPRGTVLKNNIFYLTQIDDRTQPPEYTVTCSHNLFYQTTGIDFDPRACLNSLFAEPGFVDLSNGEFGLRSDSPAIGAGEKGVNLGAAFEAKDMGIAGPSLEDPIEELGETDPVSENLDTGDEGTAVLPTLSNPDSLGGTAEIPEVTKRLYRLYIPLVVQSDG